MPTSAFQCTLCEKIMLPLRTKDHACEGGGVRKVSLSPQEFCERFGHVQRPLAEPLPKENGKDKCTICGNEYSG